MNPLSRPLLHNPAKMEGLVLTNTGDGKCTARIAYAVAIMLLGVDRALRTAVGALEEVTLSDIGSSPTGSQALSTSANAGIAA